MAAIRISLARVDTEIVTEAAARVVDADGLPALTLARLASELGVAAPSLYKHVAGLDDLILHVTTLSIRRLLPRSPREPVAVVIIEDLHWIDAASEEFAEALADAVVGTTTLLIVNFRPGFAAPLTQRSHFLLDHKRTGRRKNSGRTYRRASRF
jgi:AcrR family transcriptional regulator